MLTAAPDEAWGAIRATEAAEVAARAAITTAAASTALCKLLKVEMADESRRTMLLLLHQECGCHTP